MMQRRVRQEEDVHRAPQEPEVIELPMRSVGTRWTEGAVVQESVMRLAEEVRYRETHQRAERARDQVRYDQDWRANREWRERQRMVEDWEYGTVSMEQIRA